MQEGTIAARLEGVGMLKVKSAARTLRLLELISRRRQGLGFTEIQLGLDMPKSSANSLIKELIEQKYLFYSETAKRYYKGIEFIKLCTICIESTDLLQELTLLTAQLSAELRQTTHAAILDGRMIVYLAKHEINNSVSLMHHTGLRIPAHCTAVGKMLLSRYADETLLAMYDGYPRCVAWTFQRMCCRRHYRSRRITNNNSKKC